MSVNWKVLVMALVAAFVTAPVRSAQAAEGVKLLSGFEKARVLKWGHVEHEGKLVTKRALARKRFSSWIATGAHAGTLPQPDGSIIALT